MKVIYLKVVSTGHRLHQFLRRPYKLNVEFYGQSGPTVVLLHGIIGSISNWQFVIGELSKTHRVVAVDLLGFGKSQRPDNLRYSAKDHVKSIKYTLRQAGVKKPFVLVGHSMGSILAVHYAAAKPKHVSRLVLCSLPFYNKTDIRGRIGARWSATSDKVLLYAYRQLRKSPRVTIRGAKLLRRKDKRLAFELTHSSWYPFHQSLLHTIEQQNLSPLFNKISVPIDLVYGRRDRFLNVRNLRELDKQYPNIAAHKLPVTHELTVEFSNKVVQVISKNTISN
jgi:pimeloyl-ACP methyl ester carboxylesterase